MYKKGKIIVSIGKKQLSYEYNADLNEFLISKIALDIAKYCNEVKKKPVCCTELIVELKYLLSRNIFKPKVFTFENKDVKIVLHHVPQTLELPCLSDSDDTHYGHDSDTE